ncbi:Protein of unknown function [Ekhidna lutea]|uniref:DUF2480 family protein n=1 Tax=Ekhidna lutea TaxID=447679 RepID=A0A239ITJ7_EKHLU|nr:DUF2480 family protein [Ekhidna lutea]SNS96889.1 Protein of unknown function [Ekhidna lutea]
MANYHTEKTVAVTMDEIVNRVAKSPLVSIDLEDHLDKGEYAVFDVKETLFEGLILREKDFRSYLKEKDWSVYQDKNVGLICSADAIVPTWAYMLLVTKIKEFANVVTYGNEDAIEKELIDQAIDRCIGENNLKEKKVVIKGCGNVKNVEYAYTKITEKLFPLVSSLMYGEPCSTVPIFKRKK